MAVVEIMVDRGNEEQDGEEGDDEDRRSTTSRQESDGSSLDLKNYLRNEILETVDECLSSWEKGCDPRPAAAVDPFHRCAVCTLQHGTCVHTRQWLESRHAILDPLPKDNVDMSMDDISDVLEPASAVLGGATKNPHSFPSLSTLRWETLCALPADEVSGKKVDISSPMSRAGHSMVLLEGGGGSQEDTRLLVVFGGALFSCVKTTKSSEGDAEDGSNRNSGSEVVAPGEISQRALSYHADIHVFRVGLGTWHCPEATGDLPSGRYGHVSLALGGETMWMYGGRLQGGHQAGDTYVLDVRDMRWERTNTASNEHASPAPRVWSAAAVVRERVVLFGGADLHSGRVFDDVWTWNVQTRRWREQIVVGNPPRARYGHALLGCLNNEQVLVLGGCCVNSAAEDALPEDHDQLQLRVRVATDNVNRAYQLEEDETLDGEFDKYAKREGSLAGGKGINDRGLPAEFSDSNCNAGGHPKEVWKGESRRKARLAAAVAARESDTALREEQLRTVLYEHAAMTYWAKLRSQNPFTQMDVTFLDTESMIWGATTAPAEGDCGVAPPIARMHFAAVSLGDKIVLWGGCLPTSKRVEIGDGTVHVFDLVHRRWSRPLAECHPEGIRPRVDAAAAQLRRAQRALFEATQRAMTMGAPGGRTMQVAQAEAVIAVNRWRVQKLEDEIRRAVPSPRPRAAHAGCAVGHRVMYFGGWGARNDRKGELLVLDMEQPSAKERRLEDEFHLRLERERQAREAAEADVLRRTAMQERRRKDLELVREAAEVAVMAAEDARSAIPELTVAPVPRLRCANNTTLWLEWPCPFTDAMGNAPEECIEYTLYMRGGFREWEVGDRVLVAYMTRSQRKAATAGSTTISTRATECGSSVRGTSSFRHEGTVGSDEIIKSDEPGRIGHNGWGIEDVNSCSIRGNEEGSTASLDPIANIAKLLPAVITDTSAGGGLFDIRWDDGERERDVRRYRIHRDVNPPPPWGVIYEGDDCAYAVEGMVPEYVIEREKVFSYEVCAEFSLQTKGTEIPREKRSRHSPVVTFKTKFEGQGPPLGHGAFSRPEESQVNIKARLANAKALDDSISSNARMATSSPSRVHLMHGQHTAMGTGRLYL